MSESTLPERIFPLPPQRDVLEEYTVTAEPIDNGPGKWKSTAVTIWRTAQEGDDPVKVFEYNRNYALGKTFLPFRQLQEGAWKDYALISSEYTRLEVVDLSLGEIVAIEPYPAVTQEWLNGLPATSKEPGGWAEKHYVGEERPGWGFCPVEFRVFDWREKLTDESANMPFRDGYLYSDEKLNAYTGQWAIYTGCIWGDDGSWKVRYVDLSKIREGIVVTEERFGYLPLLGKLSDVVHSSSDDFFYFPVEVMVERQSGKAAPVGVNWMTDEEYDASNIG